MYALSRLVPADRAVASVVLSRIVDLVGLLAVLAAAWALAGAGGWGRLLLPASIVAGAVGGLFLLARLRLPASLGERFGAAGRMVGRAQEALGSTGRGALLRAFAFAAPAWVFEAGILYVVARGLGLGLSPAEVVAATCFAVLVAAVPLTPGAIGTYEAGMVAILLAFGAAAEPAFAAAVITHAMKFLYAFAAAPFAFSEGLAALEKGKVRPDEARF
ncbi:MAG: flippase-like domain-containing protein, partial [Actinomycetota bacterium]|nr:flippase-like domain-containing protein [Actinomycetota bacterium]